MPSYAAAARHEDLSGLPPTWIGVGSIDLFHQENIEYAERLHAASVHCKLDLIEMAPHGFDNLFPNTEVRRGFIAKHDEFIPAILTDKNAKSPY